MTSTNGALRAVPSGDSRIKPEPEFQNEPESASEWVKFTHALWHSRWLIVACVIVSLVLATAYNYTARPRYEAVAQIQIQKSRPDLTPGKDVVDAITPEWIETQYRILVGKTLLTKVVERYDFANSPELGTGPMRSPIELIRTKLFGRPDEFSAGMGVAPTVAAFRSRVTVRPIPRTTLVDLVFRAYDPKFAAMAANGLAQTFVDESLSNRSDQSTEATKWLEARLQDEQEQARSSFEALRSYEDRSGSSNLEARQRLVEGRLAQASTQLLEARSDRASKKAYLDQLRRLSPSELLSLPELAANSTFQAMRRDLVDIELRKSELDQSLGPKHPDVVGLDARIQSLRSSLGNEAKGVVRGVEAAYEAASRQEAVAAGAVSAAQAEMSSLRDKSPEYQTLKRDADTSNDIALALARRGKEASVESAVTDRTVRLIEPADIPKSPVFPDRTGNLQIALLVGLVTGILLVAAREKLDTTLKTPDDIREALRIPFLGLVPDLGTVTDVVVKNNISALRHPTSPLSESYRVIRTNVMATASAADARVLLVTSIHPGEGKSTTALNLAAAIAQTGATAILVDSDLRRPTVHSNLSMPRSPGIKDLLAGRGTFREVVRPGPIPGLFALTAGSAPDNPSELMGCAEMRALLKDLAHGYDWVIVDAPPVGGMADALVIGGLVDGIVLVIEGDRTTRAVAADGVAQLSSVGGRMLGAILNRVDVKKNAYYLSRYATGYYGGYGYYGAVYSRYAPSARPGVDSRAEK
ncbi:MAG: polysaccharide biosynthesis tyrosine autokinase [Vicinamibacteria bacterium]